jgi:hypothetical protein
MQVFLGVVSVLLGVINVIQFLSSIATGTSLRARAQSAYNDWFRVAQFADMISKDPSKAAELMHHVSGIADAARNEIKAYSREKLGFVPSLDPPYEAGSHPPASLGFWKKIGSAFTPK